MVSTNRPSGLIILAASIILQSCTPTMWQMRAPCSMSRTEIIDNLTALVTQVGMNVAIVNPSIGLLEARNEIQVSFWGTTTSDVWSFNVRNDSIFAYAKTLSYDKNGLVETEEYRTDETTSRSSHWYWDVRNGIEAMCEGTTIVFVKTN